MRAPGQRRVHCWGSNGIGQIGDGGMAQRLTPVNVAGLANATAIAAGSLHTCVALAGGGARCWGDNLNGQLGDGTTTARRTPVAVAGPSIPRRSRPERSTRAGRCRRQRAAGATTTMVSSGTRRKWRARSHRRDGDHHRRRHRRRAPITRARSPATARSSAGAARHESARHGPPARMADQGTVTVVTAGVTKVIILAAQIAAGAITRARSSRPARCSAGVTTPRPARQRHDVHRDQAVCPRCRSRSTSTRG